MCVWMYILSNLMHFVIFSLSKAAERKAATIEVTVRSELANQMAERLKSIDIIHKKRLGDTINRLEQRYLQREKLLISQVESKHTDIKTELDNEHYDLVIHIQTYYSLFMLCW